MSRNKTELLSFVKDLARQAGEISLKMRNNISEYSLKTPSQMVSEADKGIEEFLINKIKEKFPEDLFLAEETSSEAKQAMFTHPTWVIDPIDGTTNYLHKHNHNAVSIAYLENGEVQIGVVYMPFVDELFAAAKGLGATLNDITINCTEKNIPLDKAIIALGRPNLPDELPFWSKSTSKIFENCFDIRRLAAASGDICWIACGRLHGFWESLKPWDIAAACLIAKEAGAIIDYIEPLPAKLQLPQDLYCEKIVVSTPSISDEFIKLLRESLE